MDAICVMLLKTWLKKNLNYYQFKKKKGKERKAGIFSYSEVASRGIAPLAVATFVQCVQVIAQPPLCMGGTVSN